MCCGISPGVCRVTETDCTVAYTVDYLGMGNYIEGLLSINLKTKQAGKLLMHVYMSLHGAILACSLYYLYH